MMRGSNMKRIASSSSRNRVVSVNIDVVAPVEFSMQEIEDIIGDAQLSDQRVGILEADVKKDITYEYENDYGIDVNE